MGSDLEEVFSSLFGTDLPLVQKASRDENVAAQRQHQSKGESSAPRGSPCSEDDMLTLADESAFDQPEASSQADDS